MPECSIERVPLINPDEPTSTGWHAAAGVALSFACTEPTMGYCGSTRTFPALVICSGHLGACAITGAAPRLFNHRFPNFSSLAAGRSDVTVAWHRPRPSHSQSRLRNRPPRYVEIAASPRPHKLSALVICYAGNRHPDRRLIPATPNPLDKRPTLFARYHAELGPGMEILLRATTRHRDSLIIHAAARKYFRTRLERLDVGIAF